MLELANVKVSLDKRSYDIKIGHQLLTTMGGELVKKVDSRQVILVSNTIVFDYYGVKIQQSLEKAGFQVLTQIIPDGEQYKSWKMAEKLLSEMLRVRVNRDAIIIALGGGVIGDLAGFVASIYQRGIKFVQVPTTLLAQVDSSVGGKVGVNHELGKNMIGSFHQPLGVWVDLDTLDTLPEREWLAGLAEVIKYGVIWDEDFFGFIEKHIAQIGKRDKQVTQQLIEHSCRIKAAIVAQDEREDNLRAVLNFGHTIGHALENITEYKMYRHGEAVAIGMVLATKLAVNLNMCSKEVVDRLTNILQSLGLVTSLPKTVSIEQLIEAMLLDKKIKDKKLIFILPTRIGQVKIVKGIELNYIRQFLSDNLDGKPSA